MADGDLALLASLFPEPEDPLGALVLEVPAPQPGDRTDAGPGVGEGPEQESPIAEAHDVGGVDRTPSRSRAWGMERPGVLPSEVSCLRPRTDWKGIQGSGVASDQGVEEMPQGGQGLVFG